MTRLDLRQILLLVLISTCAVGCGVLEDPYDDAGESTIHHRHLHDGSAPDGSSEAQVLDGGASTIDEGSIDSGTHETEPAAIVILPDTQYYSAAYPAVFAQQTQWVLEQKAALHIQAVLHVGDVVDTANSHAEWKVASTALRVFDRILPYVIVPGNHDTDGARHGLIDTYFAPSTMPWIMGTMVAGKIENNYTLITVGARTWLVLGLEFGPRDSVVTWADGVLKQYADHPAIVVTHAYLYRDGTRYDIKAPTHQFFIPQDYGYTPSEGINDGEMLWQKLVLPNSNVRFVFSGHDTGAALLSSTRPDGTVVHQILSDYQWLGGEYFGYGYLRVLQLDEAQKTLSLWTYSPHLKQYLTDPANQLTLPWNLD